MIKKFAIEPAALARWEDFRYVFEKLGFSQGRVLSRFPKKWPKMLMESLGDIGDVERKRFEVKLAKFKSDRMLSSGTPYDGSIEWIANVTEHAGNFDGIILKDDVGENQGESYGTAVAALDEEFFHTEREIRTPSTVSGLTEPAKLLMQVTCAAALVDPYFKVASVSCLKVLSRLVEIGVSGGKCRAFAVYTQGDWRPKDGGRKARADLGELLRGKVQESFSINIFFKTSPADLNSFHARYLLTEKGGLRYDKGFRSTPEGDMVDISLLDNAIHTQLCELYPLPPLESQAEADCEWLF